MEDKRWCFIDEEGNVAPFGAHKPIFYPNEEHLKKVLTDWPFSRGEVTGAYAMANEAMGPRRYWAIPASHKIAKYVREHGVEVK